MNEKLYYTPLTDKAFEEIKMGSIKIWSEYDDEYNYATSKIDSIRDIKNIRDNGMYMITMFDWKNKIKLKYLLSEKTNSQIRERFDMWG